MLLLLLSDKHVFRCKFSKFGLFSIICLSVVCTRYLYVFCFFVQHRFHCSCRQEDETKKEKEDEKEEAE